MQQQGRHYGATRGALGKARAGRGTDIRLGGTDEADRDRIVSLGGLAVISTSLHPSRRLDARLLGRAGRQGDPGITMRFASL